MSAERPRIALMLSGLPRMWRDALPSQLALFRDFECDVFFHFWDTIDDNEKEEIVSLLKPRAYCFEPQVDFTHFDNDPSIRPDLINVPSRTFSQYYSWRSVGRLVEPFKNDYDLAMRSRADLQFVYEISHIFPLLKPNEILIPWWDENLLLADLFALGAIEPILYYHQIYDYVPRYAATRQFNAELMLTVHFEQRSDLHIYADRFQYFFVRRPHMTGYTVEQAMLENPGRNKWLDPALVKAHSDYHEMLKGEEGSTYVKDFRHSQLVTLLAEVKEKVMGKNPDIMKIKEKG